MAYIGNRQVTQYQSISKGDVTLKMVSLFTQAKQILIMRVV